MFWKIYFIKFRPRLEVCVLTAAKRNREREIRAEERRHGVFAPHVGDLDQEGLEDDADDAGPCRL